MPVTTAKTRMRTPEVMTWPSTGSAMNEVPRQRAKGTRMKPFSVVSLNSMTARKSMIASTKNATSVTTQERAISMISLKFQKTSGKPDRRFSLRNRDAAFDWDQWRSAREWELPAPIRCRELGDAEYLISEALVLFLGDADRRGTVHPG